MAQHLSNGTILQGSGNRYEIVRVLGQGSFGITYLAHVPMKGPLGTINVRVAIKEFFMKDINFRDGSVVTGGSGLSDGLFDKYRQKFRREAQNLSRMKHPGIVKVVESFDANGTSYIVMDYIGGGSLDNRIVGCGTIAENEALRLTQSVGNALAYMHEHHMLHLDLKPSNVMLNDQDEPILIDFGLSKFYDESGSPESSTTVGGGTPGYAPIEQASYHEGKGFPVTIDVYALGATLFKMLTGHRPPEADEIMNDGFPYGDLKGVSTPTVDAVAKAMSFRKSDRYQSVNDFLSSLALITASDEETVFEKNEETEVEQARTVRVKEMNRNENTKKKNKSVFWILAIAAIAIGIGVIVLLFQKGIAVEDEDDDFVAEEVDVRQADTPTQEADKPEHGIESVEIVRPSPMGYVDLGLSSGTLWKNRNEENESKYFAYSVAIDMFGNNLPSETQWDELRSECTWTWTGNGYNVEGRNGKSIYLPADGFRNCDGKIDFVGVGGNYWSSTPVDDEKAVALRFRAAKVYTYQNRQCNGYSVRLITH